MIGANFDEETREQQRINELRKRVITLERLRVTDAQRASVMGANPEAPDVAGIQEVNCLLEVRGLARLQNSRIWPVAYGQLHMAKWSSEGDRTRELHAFFARAFLITA